MTPAQGLPPTGSSAVRQDRKLSQRGSSPGPGSLGLRAQGRVTGLPSCLEEAAGVTTSGPTGYLLLSPEG